MTDERKNIKADAETFAFLKACKPAGTTWAAFLADGVRDSSSHLPVACERSGPTSDYVMCDRCGRTANDLSKLERRECDTSGISVKE